MLVWGVWVEAISDWGLGSAARQLLPLHDGNAHEENHEYTNE
jgi:hypothetical protein